METCNHITIARRKSFALLLLEITSIIAALIAVAAVVRNLLNAYGPPVLRPKIVCPDNDWDLGKRSAAAKIQHTFTLCNVGCRKLTINNVSAPCRCTRVLSPHRLPLTIDPRGTFAIVSELDPAGISGRFKKSLLVASDDAEQPILKLIIRGEITREPGAGGLKAPGLAH